MGSSKTGKCQHCYSPDPQLIYHREKGYVWYRDNERQPFRTGKNAVFVIAHNLHDNVKVVSISKAGFIVNAFKMESLLSLHIGKGF